ncbi:4180_t:CDS:2 [Gigaspora margarita]|uniref:4180_t:CDS:1 n=1 Tax=Gigaspora margarita TaxID=4874 RepID=A0ABN7UXN1_GIGMA|nr:4180_t:CDS:2 [Gigaspora margarita]
MSYNFNSGFPSSTPPYPSFIPNEESTVSGMNNPYNCSNLLPADLHPQIQIHEADTPVLSENQNSIKVILQDYLTPYHNYSSMPEVDRGYYSDPQLTSPTMSVDYDYGYHSDSPNNNGHHFNSQSTSTSPSVVSASYDDIFFPNQYNDGYVSDSQMNDEYLSDSSIYSCPSPQLQPVVPNGLYINTSALDPRHALSRKPKKNVTSACANCKNSHAKCDIQRPCRRCREKCIPCGSTQNRRRGRKPRSATSTPEPTSPISPSSQSTAQNLF